MEKAYFFFVTGLSVQERKETAIVVEKKSHSQFQTKKSTCLEEMFTANWFETGETRNS